MLKPTKTTGVLLALIALLGTSCIGEKIKNSTPEAPKPLSQAELTAKKIEQGSLRLDISKTEDIVTFMDRSPDKIERELDGKNRLLTYQFDDKSKLIFAMKPVGTGQGLVLNYYMVRE